jgi:hypothetical protein
MPRLNVPGEQVFPRARLAFNQCQPHPRANLMQLLAYTTHGQRA